MTTTLDDAPAIISIHQFRRERRDARGPATHLIDLADEPQQILQLDQLNERLRRVDAAHGDVAPCSAESTPRPTRCRTALVEANLACLVAELEHEVDRLLDAWTGPGQRRS